MMASRLKLLGLLACVWIDVVQGALVCEDESLIAQCSECTCSSENISSTNVTNGEDQASREDNVALAFGLVTAAGLSTAFGAALVFCERAVSQERFLLLGAALGFSSGVMLYVSFIEIFVKAVDSFTLCYELEVDPCLWDDDGSGSAPYVASTLCLFAGVAITLLLDVVVVHLSKLGAVHGHSHSKHSGNHVEPGSSNEVLTLSEEQRSVEYSPDAIGDVRAEDATLAKTVKAKSLSETDKLAENSEDVKREKLLHMGVMTALAIGLHNFPEGLATFVATLDDPTVGIALASAIAIHNIPEGLCVAIPLYYSSGSRWKGFGLALLSGVTEIIGAALGYAFLMTVLGDVAYGVLFGIVSGMMITIVMKELLPTAHRYDVDDKYVTISFFIGAAVMALSLILFVV